MAFALTKRKAALLLFYGAPIVLFPSCFLVWMSNDAIPDIFLATPPFQAIGLSKVALPGLLQSADEPDGSTLVQGQGLFYTSFMRKYWLRCHKMFKNGGYIPMHHVFVNIEAPEKDLDAFELFSGCGELSRQCRAILSYKPWGKIH